MKLASRVMVVLVVGALGGCGSGHSGGTDAGGQGGGVGGSNGGGQARGGAGGGAGTIGSGGAGGALGGSGGTSAGRGGAGGSSNSDAAADASDPFPCPATMPPENSACVRAYCIVTDGGMPMLVLPAPPPCDYGNERCGCSSGISGGCGCQPGQTICPLVPAGQWTCNPIGG
jgi:hypothetical protein